jgi:hypothetical protein
LERKAALGAEQNLVQKLVKANVVHHGAGLEVAHGDAADGNDSIGGGQEPGKDALQACYDLPQALPFHGCQGDNAPSHLVPVRPSLTKCVIEGYAEDDGMSFNLLRDRLIYGLQVSAQGSEPAHMRIPPIIHTQDAAQHHRYGHESEPAHKPLHRVSNIRKCDSDIKLEMKGFI